MLGVMIVLMVGAVSAVTYGPIGSDYSLCTHDGASDWICTSEVHVNDSSYANMDEEEEVQGRWNAVIPTNAVVTSVKVYVEGMETDPNVEANIQLWSTDTQESLTDYQAFSHNNWQTKTFQDSDLTDYVQSKVSAGQPIKLELDIEGENDDENHNEILIDYIHLKITYEIPECPFEPQDGRTIVHFSPSDKILSSGSSADAQTDNESVDLAAGKYGVSLYSWDYGVNRATQSQPNEEYFVFFYDSSGNLIAQSSDSTDLADNVIFADWEGQVDTNLVLSGAVEDVQGFHAVYPDGSSPNSLVAECAAFDFIEEPCSLEVTNPEEGDWFDNESVPINWTLSEGCQSIVHSSLYYYNSVNGECNTQGPWNEIAIQVSSANTVVNPPFEHGYLWDKPSESGQYCVYVETHSSGVKGYSEVFNVDHAKPYVNLSVGSPQTGTCTEADGEICWVKPNTPITLTCQDNNPNEPWQSGPDEIWYSINEGPVQLYTGAFSFQTDSEHDLEYWCFDKVDKESEHKFKDFFVNSESPTITKTVGEPKVNASSEEFDWYVNTGTKICLSATQGNPTHPTPGGVVIDCGYTYSLDNTNWDKIQHVSFDENGCFSYLEDSWHELSCTATDALGNTAFLSEKDIVDSQGPTTTWDHEGPYYSSENGKWVDGISNITLSATDPDSHPVGVDKIYYRYTVVNDDYCYGKLEGFEEPERWNQDWTVYTEPFGLPESCHVIEYYSNDLLGNSEGIHHEFIFSDHTAPVLTKLVGEPSTPKNENPLENWYENEGQKIEWAVTMDTPIEISCEDSSPHPSGIGNTQGSGIYWRVVLDGEYNSSSAQWQNSSTDHVTIWFKEQSEHLLEFYCVDNVGKKSETDSELFKVIGSSFDLIIGDKWDLISVPFNLLSNDIDEVFGNNSDITGIWGYDPSTGWHLYAPGVTEDDLTTIEPGHGYWIKTDSETTVLIGGSLFSPQSVPAAVELQNGWNLIGHYGTSNKNSWCSLFSLVDTSVGFPRWSSLWGYDSPSQDFVPLSAYDNTNPGRGYWVEMDVNDTYVPSSICWGLN